MNSNINLRFSLSIYYPKIKGVPKQITIILILLIMKQKRLDTSILTHLRVSQ